MKKLYVHTLLAALLVCVPACSGKAARSENTPNAPVSVKDTAITPESMQVIMNAKDYLKNNPGKAEAHYRLGAANLSAGMYDEAVKAFIETIRINPDHAEAHNSLGIAYGKLNIHDEAIEEFMQAVRIRPEYAEALVNMGLSFEKMDRLNGAITAYEGAIDADNEYVAAYYNLGNVHLKQGDYIRAVKALEHAVRLNPDDVMAHFNLGIAYAKSKRRGLALDEYKRLKELDRDKADALFDIIYEIPAPEK